MPVGEGCDALPPGLEDSAWCSSAGRRNLRVPPLFSTREHEREACSLTQFLRCLFEFHDEFGPAPRWIDDLCADRFAGPLNDRPSGPDHHFEIFSLPADDKGHLYRRPAFSPLQIGNAYPESGGIDNRTLEKTHSVGGVDLKVS